MAKTIIETSGYDYKVTATPDEFEDIINLVRQQVVHELYKWQKETSEAERALTQHLDDVGSMSGEELTKWCEEHKVNLGLWLYRKQPQYQNYKYHLELLQKVQQSYDKWSYGPDYDFDDFEYGLGWSS